MQREAISGRLMNPGPLTPMLMTNQRQPDYSFTKAQCMTSVLHEHRGSARVSEWAGVQCQAGVQCLVGVERAASAHHAYGGTLAPMYWVPKDHHACWPQQPSVLPNVPPRAPPAPPANSSLRINLQGENDRILQEFRPARGNTTFNPARSVTPQETPPAPAAAASRDQRGGFRHLELEVLEEQSANSASSWRRQRRCNFCVMNGEEDVFHVFKDRRGRVVCPVLSAYKCPICGATGYSAHTIKYCPRNKITKGDPVAAGLPPGIMPSCFKYEDIV